MSTQGSSISIRTLIGSTLSVAIALLFGCADTGPPSEVPAPPQSVKTATQSPGPVGPRAAQTPSAGYLKTSKPVHVASWPGSAHPIVAIRYVAAVDEDAMPSFRRQFNEGPYYLDHKRDDGDAYGGPPQASMAILTVAQSTYFAVQLRERLAEILPGAIVVLEPGRVVKSQSTRTLQWDTPADTLTPDLLLDFTAYVSPQPIVFDAGTFYLLATIRVGAQFAPTTHGLIATSRGLAGLGSVTEQADPFDPYTSLGSTVLDLIQSADRQFQKIPPVLGQSLYAADVSWDNSKVVLIEHYHSIAWRPEKTKSGEYTLSVADVSPLKNIIIDSLNFLVAQPTYGSLTRNFVASFDPMLASSQSADPLQARKLSTLRQFREAEAKFLSKTSELMSESLKDSALSDSIREYESEQLSVARKAKVSAIFALVGAAAGAVAKNPTMTANANQQALTDMAQFEKSVREVDLKVAQTQSQVSVNLLDKEQTISASSLGELHAKLKNIYAGAFPSNAPQVTVTRASAAQPSAVGVTRAPTKK
jgi:hypothetical protein